MVDDIKDGIEFAEIYIDPNMNYYNTAEKELFNEEVQTASAGIIYAEAHPVEVVAKWLFFISLGCGVAWNFWGCIIVGGASVFSKYRTWTQENNKLNHMLFKMHERINNYKSTEKLDESSVSALDIINDAEAGHGIEIELSNS